MHGYRGFIDDVENSFKWLIDQYSPKIETKSDVKYGEYAVQIVLDKSIVLFDLDRMDLLGNFINPLTGQQYHINRVYEFIVKEKFPFSMADVRSLPKEDNVRKSLYNYSQVIRDCLQNVLEGDFSWAKVYDDELEEEKKLVAKVWRLPYSHPVYQKFITGDSSWKVDIKNVNIK